jgi:DNA repair protein RadC
MEQLDLFKPGKPPRRKKQPHEWRVVSVQECPTPEHLMLCDSPQKAADYWRLHIEGHPLFDAQRECFVVLLLNTKLRARGHHFVSVGALNESMAHPREVFRAAVIAAAYAVVFLHNHPSGEPEPSQADLTITKRLVDSANVLGIRVTDHVIIGHQRHCSLREMGLI